MKEVALYPFYNIRIGGLIISLFSSQSESAKLVVYGRSQSHTHIDLQTSKIKVESFRGL